MLQTNQIQAGPGRLSESEHKIPSIACSIVSDPSAFLAWDKLLRNRLKRGQRTFPSFFCYTWNHSAEEWIRRSSFKIVDPDVESEFLEASKEIISPALTASSLTIVDVGIGDPARICPILSRALESGTILHFVMLDINEDLLKNSLLTSNHRVQSVQHDLAQYGRMTMLHCDYRFLRRHRELLSQTEKTCLVMLGNTLGNELRPVRVLRRLRQALRPGDQIILELQATEPDGLTDRELTGYFQQNFEFYAGPLFSQGISKELLELRVCTARDDDGIEIVSASILLSSKAVISDGITIYPGQYTFMSITRFEELSIRKMMAEAGLVVKKLFHSGTKEQLGRPFYYVNAALPE